VHISARRWIWLNRPHAAANCVKLLWRLVSTCGGSKWPCCPCLFRISLTVPEIIGFEKQQQQQQQQQNHFTSLVQDYPGEPVPEDTHPPSWSSSNLYQLLPSTTIHSILPVQITCLAIFLRNLCPHPIWSTSWSGALHLIFHTFLDPVSVFFSQHMPIPSQPVLL